jgi:hypothetical protein
VTAVHGKAGAVISRQEILQLHNYDTYNKDIYHMEQKQNFFESEVCTSQLHCKTCRLRFTGRSWRTALRKTFRLPDANFECPHGKPLIEDGSGKDKNIKPERKPCKGCGKTSNKKLAKINPANGNGENTVDSATTADATNKNTAQSSAPSMWDAASPPILGETRDSCLECVEKHIGAAMVLLSETKNGYPHYLLAVGHLHEAEEESQVWPELATAIRNVRKELQQTGNIPNWNAIADTMC